MDSETNTAIGDLPNPDDLSSMIHFLGLSIFLDEQVQTRIRSKEGHFLNTYDTTESSVDDDATVLASDDLRERFSSLERQLKSFGDKLDNAKKQLDGLRELGGWIEKQLEANGKQVEILEHQAAALEGQHLAIEAKIEGCNKGDKGSETGKA